MAITSSSVLTVKTYFHVVKAKAEASMFSEHEKKLSLSRNQPVLVWMDTVIHPSGNVFSSLNLTGNIYA